MSDKASVTDKANEQGWGSTVKAASEQIQATTDAVAEKIRGTVGDTVADGLKTGGVYTKAGIQNTGEYVGLKGSKVQLLAIFIRVPFNMHALLSMTILLSADHSGEST